MVELLNQVEQIAIDTVLKLLESFGRSATEKLVSFLHHQAQLGATAS